jgi:GPH family glycoside/pentoside/hexuronide:cation symporter
MSSIHAGQPRAEDRIPLGQKIAFSFGGKMSYLATDLLTGILWMPFFNIGLGVSPIMLGLILMALRAWDAITDPVIGNWSDNTRTRWGRRRPFIAVGAVLTGLIYPFLWQVPVDWNPSHMALYLVVVGCCFYTAFTVWSMPYYSLQLELTPDYDERTRLTAWMAFFSKLVSLGGGWMLALLSSSWFADPVTGKPDIVHGMRVCSWFIGGIIIMMGLLPALFVRERYYQADASHQSKTPFWKSLKESARCGPLWCLIGASFFTVLGTVAISGLNQYLYIYFLGGGDIARASFILGLRSIVLISASILMIPVWTKLGERYDKKRMVIVTLLISMTGHLLNLVLMRPDLPYLQFISALFESASLSAFWLFLPSMKADVADYDERTTRHRREGSLNSIYSWFIKVSSTLAVGLSGFVLEISGFESSLEQQPESVLMRMFHIYLVLPIFFWGIAIGCIFLYPLGRRKMESLRTELESMRGKI